MPDESVELSKSAVVVSNESNDVPGPTAQIKLPATSKKNNTEEEQAKVLANLDDDASRKLRMLPVNSISEIKLCAR